MPQKLEIPTVPARSISEHLRQALEALAAQMQRAKEEDKPAAKVKPHAKPEPDRARVHLENNTQSKVAPVEAPVPEAIAVIEAAKAAGQPLEQLAVKIPPPEEAPRLINFLANSVKQIAEGTPVEQIAGRLRNAITRGQVEFKQSTRVLRQMVENLGRPDLYFGVQGASNGGSTAVDKIFNETSDDLAGTFLEDKLREIKFRLITDTDAARHDTHKLARLTTELEDDALRHGRFDSPEVQTQVREAKARIQAVIDETVASQQPRGREAQTNPEFLSKKERNWIYDAKNTEGIAKELADRTEIGEDGKPILRDMQPLRDAAQQLEGLALGDNERDYEMARSILNKTLERGMTRDELEPYAKKVRETYSLWRGERWRVSFSDLQEIKTNWKRRDEIFYERIGNVLHASFQQSREVMNLYEEVGVDAFIKAVESFDDKLADHYRHLKQSIFLNHDLDIIARNAAGDVELFKKLTHIAHTSFMREATTDPLAVAMISSYEQALRKILHDNNGHLPSSLFGFDEAGNYKNESNIHWDVLALKFLKQKIAAGAVFDKLRDAQGRGIPRKDNIGYEIGQEFTMKDFEEQKGRILATMNMAKGVGIFSHRILEIFASAQAAGLGTADWQFGSIPYEGIARFFRPHDHLFGKYGMGELSHHPIFHTLFGGPDIPPWLNYLTFKPNDWMGIKDAVAEGTLENWIMKKYAILGKDRARKIAEKAIPFQQFTQEFSWTGRFGPHSGWGENDVTIYYTDKKREIEGGSMRLAKAEWWANRYLENKYGVKEWAMIQYTPQAQKDLENLARTYKTWIWAQLTLRSPEIVAENVYVTEDGLASADKTAPNLRKVLIRKILKIDIDTQVATEATPNQTQRNFSDRIAILDADIAAIQQKALYGGDGNMPREIIDSDFDVIQDWPEKDDPNNPYRDPTTDQIISADERRTQAKLYIQGVKKAVLGKMQTMKAWKIALGVSDDSTKEYEIKRGQRKGQKRILHDMLEFEEDKWKNIDNILKNVMGETVTDEYLGETLGKLGKLNQKLIERPQEALYMGMDDVRWGDLDIANLGERAFARLTNDLEYRKAAIEKMMELLGMFKAKMPKEQVYKVMEEMYRTELAGRGPDSGRAFVYYFGELFGQYYRGRALGALPGLGKLLRRVGPDLSIAQMVHGKEDGEIWSINNEKEHMSHINQINALPYRDRERNGAKNKFSIKRMERELVASPAWAIGEAFVIGYFIAAGFTIAAAGVKAKEDQSD